MVAPDDSEGEIQQLWPSDAAGRYPSSKGFRALPAARGDEPLLHAERTLVTLVAFYSYCLSSSILLFSACESCHLIWVPLDASMRTCRLLEHVLLKSGPSRMLHPTSCAWSTELSTTFRQVGLVHIQLQYHEFQPLCLHRCLNLKYARAKCESGQAQRY